MTIHDLEPILREHPFFNGMSDEHVRILVGCAKNIRCNEGDFFCRFGKKADEFYIIRNGKVNIEIDIPQQGSMTIQTLEDGDIVGWSWLFPPYKWNFDARALQLTRAISLDADCLRNKCELDHDLGYELMKRFSAMMMERLQATRLQLLDFYAGPAGAKG